MIKWNLYLQFLKIGLFSIGGGLSTLPFLFELAQKNLFITKDQLVNMIAISQCTPGPIGINVATFVGIQNGGMINGVLTTISLVIPSFVIIYAIAKYLDKQYTTQRIQLIFKYLRPCALGFMLVALLNIVKVSVTNWQTLIMVMMVFYIEYKCPKHPLKYLLLSGLIGIIIF